MSKRMVKNAWERSYRCNKVFKPICFCFWGDVELYRGWFGSIGSIFLAAAARIFRCYACVFFFYGVPTKRGSVGAYSCFTNQPPWITVRADALVLEYTATISPKQIENLTENVTVLRIFPFFVAALQQMPPQPIPHYHQAGQATEKIRCPDPERFHAFLLRVYSSMFDRSKDKMCVIIRLMVARNDLTGVFLDRHGWFARPLWQSLRYLRLTCIVTCLVCIQYFH